MEKPCSWNANVLLKCPTKKDSVFTSHRCTRISASVSLFQTFFEVHTTSSHKCNTFLRASLTHSLLYNFYFYHILHHSKSLRQYLICSITTHKDPFGKQALIMNFPLCRIASTHLSRSEPSNIVNERKMISEWIRHNDFQTFESVRFYLSFHIDTHHSRPLGELYRCWRGTTSGSNTAEQHSKTPFLLIDCIYTIINQYRHSSRSIFPITISVLKEHNIWLKHCTTTQ
jgi:hypothetical protein